jgi:hypothetical protein
MTPEKQQLHFENTARAIKGASQMVLIGTYPTAPKPMRLMARE